MKLDEVFWLLLYFATKLRSLLAASARYPSCCFGGGGVIGVLGGITGRPCGHSGALAGRMPIGLAGLGGGLFSKPTGRTTP